MKFKIGDKVKQIKALNPGENPHATITKIEGIKIYHEHIGGTHGYCICEDSLKFISQDEIIYD